MDALYAVDCQRYIPNRFDLVLAAAVRARALARGAEPRAASAKGFDDLALREIALGCFDASEIQALLETPWRRAEDLIAASGADEDALRDGMAHSGAIALAFRQREALVTATMNEGA